MKKLRDRLKGGIDLNTLIIILVVLLLLGCLPLYPYSVGWGYYPSGGLVLILIVIFIFLR